MKNPLFRHIARTLEASIISRSRNNAEWAAAHQVSIDRLTNEFMPSGSGIDSGTKFDFGASKPNRLVFTTSYHHMDEHGGYDGWSEHSVIVTPSLTRDFDIKITGRDRNEIKEYLYEVFNSALSEIIEETADGFTCPRIVEAARKFQQDVKDGKIV